MYNTRTLISHSFGWNKKTDLNCQIKSWKRHDWKNGLWITFSHGQINCTSQFLFTTNFDKILRHSKYIKEFNPSSIKGFLQHQWKKQSDWTESF